MSTRSRSVQGNVGGGGSTAGGSAVPLAVLLRREVVSERTAAERPELQHGLFSQAKKGEDFVFLKPDCERLPGVPSSSFSAFGLFDGHNGNGAAIYTKENLLNNILGAVPADLNREDWLAALPRAMVAAFVKTDKDFQTVARSSGTTVTFVIIDGLVVTVASVGDSRCVLEAEGSIYQLSSDHRFDASKEEVDRVTEAGGDVGRLNVVGGAEIGPLRCWPGGLCLSRTIGDQDVGEFIVPVPLVKQVKGEGANGCRPPSPLHCCSGQGREQGWRPSDRGREHGGGGAQRQWAVQSSNLGREGRSDLGVCDGAAATGLPFSGPLGRPLGLFFSSAAALQRGDMRRSGGGCAPLLWSSGLSTGSLLLQCGGTPARGGSGSTGGAELRSGEGRMRREKGNGGSWLSTAGGRLIISSDGVWDALTAEQALNCSRGLPPEAAAEQIVKEAVHSKGLRDDTTCIVVDLVPEKGNPAMSAPKKQPGMGVFKNMFRKKTSSDSSSHADREYMDPDVVEEIFEDECALLSRRLDSEYPVRNMFKLFICAICQVELKPNQGISVHEDSSQPGNLRRWDGPFLCQSCQEKKEAMEGKRRSRDSSSRNSGSSE